MAHYFAHNKQCGLVAVFSPKCACQSIKHWFLTAADPNYQGDSTNLSRYAILPAELAKLGDCYIVLFIRDPLQRLVSFYANWVVKNSTNWCFADDARRFGLQYKSFRQFVYVVDHLSRHRMKLQHHLQHQTEKLSGIEFDKVVLVESLDEGLSQLNNQLGINGNIQRRNRTQYSKLTQGPAMDRSPAWLRQHGVPPADAFYDEELRELVENAYADDIAFYRDYQCISS